MKHSFCQTYAILYDAQSIKRAFMQFADNAGPDQAVHSHRLSRAFVAHLQNQWLLRYMLTNRECPYQAVQVHMLIRAQLFKASLA